MSRSEHLKAVRRAQERLQRLEAEATAPLREQLPDYLEAAAAVLRRSDRRQPEERAWLEENGIPREIVRGVVELARVTRRRTPRPEPRQGTSWLVAVFFPLRKPVQR